MKEQVDGHGKGWAAAFKAFNMAALVFKFEVGSGAVHSEGLRVRAVTAGAVGRR